MEIEIDLIRSSPYQPRLIFDQANLKAEIEKDGLLSDLVVRKKGEFFELIDGERRWRALKELGWKTVPVQVVDVDDKIARLSVYKLNKIRENYTVEEEANYFKKLSDEGMTPLEISKELNVDFHWVLAHINAFKFPEDIQSAVWTKQISMSHIAALESVIGKNMEEAVLAAREILNRKLTVAETKKIVRAREMERKAKVEEMRIKAVEKILPTIAPEIPKPEAPEELEEAAEALMERAQMIREGASTPGMSMRLAEPIEVERMPRIEEEQDFMQTIKGLREKIEMLEKEKERLLESRDFLKQALSFNCPYCNHACVIYREGDRYWVE